MVAVVGLSKEIWRDPGVLFGVADHWSVAQGRHCWAPGGGDPEASIALAEGGQTVAVAGAFTPQLHARRLWAFVEVAPSARGRGLGALALRELRSRLPADSRLRCKAELGSPGDRFARREGLAVLQHTQTVRATITGFTLAEAAGSASPTNVSDDVLDAWRRYYLAGHSWDPATDQPLDFWREALGSADDLVLTWPPEPPFRGLAILGENGEWTGGAIDRDDPDASHIAMALLGAAAAIHPTLEVELDGWMTEVRDALCSFPTETLDHSVILGEPA